ncbi:MAG: hypothetical protein ACI8PZ_003342 [Myxococcota bacterium]|jgi:hypothetical protein
MSTRSIADASQALSAHLFGDAEAPDEAWLAGGFRVVEGGQRLTGRAARHRLRELHRRFLQLQLPACTDRSVIMIAEEHALGGQGRILTAVLTLRRSGDRVLRLYWSDPMPSHVDEVRDTRTDRALASLGFLPLDGDGARGPWSALRDRVPALDPTPTVDGVWAAPDALLVRTGWIGAVALLWEMPTGPVHTLGSMGNRPLRVPVWAWRTGLSHAASGPERRQDVTLRAPSSAAWEPAVAALRRWSPDLICHPFDGGVRLISVDLFPAWGLLHDAALSGSLTLDVD